MGKGDKNRTKDVKQYEKNYTMIDWESNKFCQCKPDENGKAPSNYPNAICNKCWKPTNPKNMEYTKDSKYYTYKEGVSK